MPEARTVGISGVAVLATLGGAMLAYSGLKGKGFAGIAKSLIEGQNPSTAAQTNPITSSVPGTQIVAQDASGNNVVTSPGGTGTYQEFWNAVFQAVGRPSSLGNLEAMAGIAQFEGLNNYYNPMNIEWHPGDNPIIQGTGNWNSVGVQTYGSMAQGVAATAAFLQEPHWAGVMTALTTGNYDIVNAAIKQAYSWAAYVPPSKSTADSILAAQMGGS